MSRLRSSTKRIITRARRCGLVAAQRGCARCAPCDGGVELGGGGERHPRLHLAGRRVEDVGEAAGAPGHALAVDEVADLLHVFPPSLGFAADLAGVVGPPQQLRFAGRDLQFCSRMAVC